MWLFGVRKHAIESLEVLNHRLLKILQFYEVLGYMEEMKDKL